MAIMYEKGASKMFGAIDMSFAACQGPCVCARMCAKCGASPNGSQVVVTDA